MLPSKSFSCFILLVAVAAAFQPAASSSYRRHAATKLFAAPMGPLARAKKAMDPKDYNRVVEEKMKKEGLTRQQAETEYNAFLENPPFYYALDQKEKYYKSLGYKNMREGRIGEAEKEGRGEEERAKIQSFENQSRIKAFSVLTAVACGYLYFRQIYLADPENFTPGIGPM